MDLTHLPDLKLALKLAGLKPNKLMGQHFLIDRPVLERIVKTADLKSDDTVLEIGPGLGVLTDELVRRVKKVIVIEKDPNFTRILKSKNHTNLEVIDGDFLTADLSKLVDYKVVANLPYYITSAAFKKLLQTDNRSITITVLVQKEIAERITAQPGQMSVLAVSVQYYSQPKLVEIVPAASFWPPPKVDSAILKIDVFDQPVFAADDKKLFRLIKAGFGEKRKMLKNALAGGLAIDTTKASQLLAAAKISPTARAQELSLNDWQRLYDAFEKR